MPKPLPARIQAPPGRAESGLRSVPPPVKPVVCGMWHPGIVGLMVVGGVGYFYDGEF